MVLASQQFEALKHLTENWDGYGAAPPDHDIVDLATALARLMETALRKTQEGAPALHVSPTRIGGVLLEWEDNAAEHEIEIHPDRSFGFLDRNKSTGQILARRS